MLLKRQFVRQHAEKSDDSQLLKVVSSIRQDADGKTIYNLSRAQYDDEAVTLGQMKDTTDKKKDMGNLLPQTLKKLAINTRLWQQLQQREVCG